MRTEFRFAQNQEEAGGVLGISARTFCEWVAQGCDCWVEGRGYSIRKALAWAVANRWNTKQPADPENLDRMEAAELRCKVADAAIKEAKAEQLLSSLVDREAVVDAIDDILDAIRDRLQKVPAEVATAFPDDYRADAVLDLQGRIALIVREIDSWQASQSWSGATVATDDEQQQPQETESEATIEAD